MKTKKIWANLSVEDVEKTRKFYNELGFKSNEGKHNNSELASFKVGEDDFVVHFFSRGSDQFKESIGGPVSNLNNGNEVMFTLSADSREEVDQWAVSVKKAGGTVFSEPQTVIQEGWYGCGFSDPDGHKWNVFYMSLKKG